MGNELPEELVITLRKPVTAGDQTYTELRLREPTGDEVVMMEARKGTAADILGISLIAGVPVAAVERIGARDLVQAAEYLGAFLEVVEAEDHGDELVIPLRKPMAAGDQTYTELRLREPTGAEMVKVEALKGTAADILGVALVTGLPATSVGRFNIRTIARGARFLSGFMKGGQPTGAP